MASPLLPRYFLAFLVGVSTGTLLFANLSVTLWPCPPEKVVVQAPVQSGTRFVLTPASCEVANSSQAAHTFDLVYARGFRPVAEWERVKPFDVRFDSGTGSAVITMDMVAHYYKWENAASRLSLSGGGSELQTTKATLLFMEEVIATYNISSLLDVPCGDANWQFSSAVVDRLHIYAGLDVASFPIELNTRRFAHHSNKLFRRWDVAACELPRWARADTTTKPLPFELIVSRDMIQHMPLALGKRAVQHWARSGARYLLTTTFPDRANRDDQRSDAFYANNLQAAPFNFPKPVKCVVSHPEHETDLLCLYDLREVKKISEKYTV